MTIIQKHGSKQTLIDKPTLLEEYQLGYAKAEGDNYKGELYIREGNKVHPITDQVKDEIMTDVHNIERNILSKIRNGKIKAVDNFNELVKLIDDDNALPADKRQLEANYQFIVKTDDRPNHEGHNDTVLWIVVDRDAGKEYNLENAIFVGEDLVAEPVTHLEYTYHDPKSVDGPNRSTYDTENEYVAALETADFGIAVGEVDEEGNTIDIGLTPKTTDFLRELNNLGLVGGVAGSDLFSKGFVNNVELVKGENNSDLVSAGAVGGVQKPFSAIQLKISGKNKDASNEWQNYTDTVTIDLNDLVIDEGSWSE